MTIRLPGRVPMTMYFIAPATSMVSFFVLVILIPQMTILWEMSVICLRTLKGKCRTKYEIRLARPLRNVAISGGPVGPMTKSWKMAILENIVNYTIDLLLT